MQYQVSYNFSHIHSYIQQQDADASSWALLLIPYFLFLSQTIMNNKGDRYTIIAGGTSRNICKAICQPLLETDGLTLGGPI